MTLPKRPEEVEFETAKMRLEKSHEIALNAEELLCFCNRFIKMSEWAINHKTLEELEGMESQWLEIEQTLAKLTSFKGE